MEDLFSSKKCDKVHILAGKDGAGGKGRERSPLRGGSDRASKHSDRKKGNKDKKQAVPQKIKNKNLLELQRRSQSFRINLPQKGEAGQRHPLQQVQGELWQQGSQPRQVENTHDQGRL